MKKEKGMRKQMKGMTRKELWQSKTKKHVKRKRRKKEKNDEERKIIRGKR